MEGQVDSQRINSIRIQIGMGKISALLGEDFQSIEYYKKSIRLGIIELERENKNMVCAGNTRVLTRAMADGYLEIGHILEKQRNLREAMSFYLSAFLTTYKSHEDLAEQFQCDLRKLIREIAKQPLDSYFSIGEEAIDALTHVAYIQWKFGKLKDAEGLLIDALRIAERTSYPYRIASQMFLLGFFFFRSSQIPKALEYFDRIKKEDKDDISETPLPDSIITSTQEAISCCILSEAKDDNDLKKSFHELEKVFCRVDSTTDIRQIIEFKLLQFKLYQRWLRAGTKGKITDPTHAELLNNLFLLVRNRRNDIDYKKENPNSIRLYFHLSGMICWHIFSVVTLKLGKDRNEIKKKRDFVKLEKKIINDVNELLKQCHPFFESISKECIDATENKNSYVSYVYSYLEKEDFKGPLQYISIHKIKDDHQVTTLRELFLFLEQVLLLCHRIFHENVFTAAASDPADRLGYFYLWIYSNFTEKGNKKTPGLKFDKLEEKTSEKFFKFSIFDQQTYKSYLPDQAFPSQSHF